MGNIFDPMPPAKKYEPKPNLKRRLEEAKNVKPPAEPDEHDKKMIAADAAKAAAAKQKQHSISYGTWQCGRCQKATTDIGGMLDNGTLVCDDCYSEVYPDDATFYPWSRYWARCSACADRHDSGRVAYTRGVAAPPYRWRCACGVENTFDDDGDDGLPVAEESQINEGLNALQAVMPAFTGWSTAEVGKVFSVPAELLDSGLVSRNEAREKEGLPRVAEMDIVAPAGKYPSANRAQHASESTYASMPSFLQTHEGCGYGGCGMWELGEERMFCAACFDKYKGE